MRSPPATISPITSPHASIQTLVVTLLLLGSLVSIISAQREDVEDNSTTSILLSDKTTTTTIPQQSLSLWQSAFVDLCATIAPYGAILCFLAPYPTITQISRDKTVGNLPLLPYSSMVANGFVWVMYGIMKNERSVWIPNTVGVFLGAYYFATFVRYCGPMATNLPGTVGGHLKGTGAVLLFNLSLAASGISNADDVIGKEGVFFCIVLFASPLSALKTVIANRSAASIPLPFTVATFINCLAWAVMGWWKMRDFNIYFPNLLGLSCAVAQMALKGVYGNRSFGGKELPK